VTIKVSLEDRESKNVLTLKEVEEGVKSLNYDTYVVVEEKGSERVISGVRVQLWCGVVEVEMGDAKVHLIISGRHSEYQKKEVSFCVVYSTLLQEETGRVVGSELHLMGKNFHQQK
jgi:SpoU rRNA methylase family enzyme